jgi:hypothetical protein
MDGLRIAPSWSDPQSPLGNTPPKIRASWLVAGAATSSDSLMVTSAGMSSRFSPSAATAATSPFFLVALFFGVLALAV